MQNPKLLKRLLCDIPRQTEFVLPRSNKPTAEALTTRPKESSRSTADKPPWPAPFAPECSEESIGGIQASAMRRWPLKNQYLQRRRNDAWQFLQSIQSGINKELASSSQAQQACHPLPANQGATMGCRGCHKESSGWKSSSPVPYHAKRLPAYPPKSASYCPEILMTQNTQIFADYQCVGSTCKNQALSQEANGVKLPALK